MDTGPKADVFIGIKASDGDISLKQATTDSILEKTECKLAGDA